MAVDADQRWDAEEAIRWTKAPAGCDPYWIEEPTGEHVQNRIVFKQLLQAGALDVLQLDAARVGLCGLVPHLSKFDYVALSGTTEDRVIEYADHLHDHFLDPVVIREGHYTAPTAPGFSATMRPEPIARHTYPDGAFWAADLATDRKEQPT